MRLTTTKIITGLALFSMFFGAGNLILPPFLGYQSGSDWPIVSIGFLITAVCIPILGIFAHAKLQGTMYDFGKSVSPLFSTLYCFIVYAISIALPAPRTASVTYEMAIAPYFDNISSLITSTIYFGLVFIFVINRTQTISVLGKLLTPLIVIILLAIISIGFFDFNIATTSVLQPPFTKGLLEGYQTFDAIGAVVVGGVVIISLKQYSNISESDYYSVIKNAGVIAGIGLLIIYAGLIYCGSHLNIISENPTRTDILTQLSTITLGQTGTVVLSILVALACFTTAIGIITGTADYIKGVCNNSNTAYTITAIVSCVLGVLIGQFDVHYIIDVALPILMFIYPITIVLILLNVLPKTWATPQVFKAVIITTFIFSIPDVLGFITPKASLTPITNYVPLAQYHLGWVLPALLAFVVSNSVKRFN